MGHNKVTTTMMRQSTSPFKDPKRKRRKQWHPCKLHQASALIVAAMIYWMFWIKSYTQVLTLSSVPVNVDAFADRSVLKGEQQQQQKQQKQQQQSQSASTDMESRVAGTQSVDFSATDRDFDDPTNNDEEPENENDAPIITDDWSWEDLLAIKSPLRDKTIRWKKNVDRIWMIQDESKADGDDKQSLQQQQSSETLPPAILVLTNYGWNKRNPYFGRGYIRSWRQRELLEGIVNHPWFHPEAWNEIQAGTRSVLNSTRYYVFLDMETCLDKNYPHYLNKIANLDQIGKRGQRYGLSHKDEILNALQSPIFTASPESKLILFDCNGYSRSMEKEDQFWRREWNQDQRIVLASLSAHDSQLLPVDMGLPPPACQKCRLSRTRLESVQECRDEEERQYLLTFAGNFRSQARQDLLSLHNGKDILVGNPDSIAHVVGAQDPISGFKTMASRTRFAAVPRGDNLFSYRFTEVLSCGAIPVVYADGWVFPFRKEFADPASYAVRIPEDRINETVAILSAIPEDVRCRMRRKGMELYRTYLIDAQRTIQGIVETLELVHKG